MAKVYTFPDQDTIAGTLGFEFTVSNGTGTQTLDSKFFSSEFSCGSQTEFFAGDLQSVFADFIVDNDEDLLFSGEILPAMNDGAYVTVKVTLDGDVFFRGSIEPTTISSFTINTTNDALDNEKTGYKFRCNWVFSLLKEITTGQLFTQINSDKTKYKVFNIPSRFSSTASPGGTSLSMVPLSGIINAILDLFTANYGYTIDYSNDSSDMIFVSEPSSEYKKKYFFPNYFQIGRAHV